MTESSRRNVQDAVKAIRQHLPQAWQDRLADGERADAADHPGRNRWRLTGVVLGSGLGGLADQIEPVAQIAFPSIPGFARSTAHGHRGQLIFGTLGSSPVVAMAGRLHRYEGWSTAEVTFPAKVITALGAKQLIVSNAAGGVNPKLSVGDIVVIRDHINWLHERRASRRHRSGTSDAPDGAPAATASPGRIGNVYSARLARGALVAARRGGFTAVEGTYLATLGPTYETRAEYRMMRRIGADVVGMSTVPEVLVARNWGAEVLALSVVSNVADPDRPIKADHAEVLDAGKAASEKLEKIVRHVMDSQ